MNISPRMLKWILNLYPPYRGAGIRVDHIDSQWKEIRVSLKLRWFNKNIVGTHFGGNLYSLADPHLMLLLMNRLGKDYIVWDKTATIEFMKPGKGKISALFSLPDETLHNIIEQTESRGKCLPEFTVFLTNENHEKIAKVKKVLYVRKKKITA